MAETTTGFKSIPDRFLISRASHHWSNYDEEPPENPLPYPMAADAVFVVCKDKYGISYRSWAIDIKSIEDLKKIGDLTGHQMVVTFNMERYGLPRIEIYDDHIE